MASSYIQGPSEAGRDLLRRRVLPAVRPIMPGGLIALVGGLVFALSCLLPFSEATVEGGNASKACAGLSGTDLYSLCVHRIRGGNDRAAAFHWNAWHRFSTWVPVLVLLLVAVIFIAKLLGYHPRKRRLESTALILVIVSDVLFFWAFSNTKDGEVRAWGIYLALVLLIIVNIGALLAFVNVDGIMAARAKEREKRTTPADPYDKGHYPVGQSPRYDTPDPPQQPPSPSGGYVPPPS